jgi:hypothetical protein
VIIERSGLIHVTTQNEELQRRSVFRCAQCRIELVSIREGAAVDGYNVFTGKRRLLSTKPMPSERRTGRFLAYEETGRLTDGGLRLWQFANAGRSTRRLVASSSGRGRSTVEKGIGESKRTYVR